MTDAGTPAGLESGAEPRIEQHEYSLEELRKRHQAIARYRIVLVDWSKPRKKQRTEIARNFTWQGANARRDELEAELKIKLGRTGHKFFGDPGYEIELTNAWECMTPQARERHLALGGKPGDKDHEQG